MWKNPIAHPSRTRAKTMIERHTKTGGGDVNGEDRARMFLECFRMAVTKGFYTETFAQMKDANIVHLCTNYIVHHTENLTIMDPHFLECLYGEQAVRKAHWLTELRMRRQDIVPALYKDLFSKSIISKQRIEHAKVTIGEEEIPVKKIEIDISRTPFTIADIKNFEKGLNEIARALREEGHVRHKELKDFIVGTNSTAPCQTCGKENCVCKKPENLK